MDASHPNSRVVRMYSIRMSCQLLLHRAHSLRTHTRSMRDRRSSERGGGGVVAICALPSEGDLVVMQLYADISHAGPYEQLVLCCPSRLASCGK